MSRRNRAERRHQAERAKQRRRAVSARRGFDHDASRQLRDEQAELDAAEQIDGWLEEREQAWLDEMAEAELEEHYWEWDL